MTSARRANWTEESRWYSNVFALFADAVMREGEISRIERLFEFVTAERPRAVEGIRRGSSRTAPWTADELSAFGERGKE